MWQKSHSKCAGGKKLFKNLLQWKMEMIGTLETMLAIWYSQQFISTKNWSGYHRSHSCVQRIFGEQKWGVLMFPMNADLWFVIFIQTCLKIQCSFRKWCRCCSPCMHFFSLLLANSHQFLMNLNCWVRGCTILFYVKFNRSNYLIGQMREK